MDTRRIILYAALVFVVYSLWTAWQQDYPLAKSPASITELDKTRQTDGHLLPSVGDEITKAGPSQSSDVPRSDSPAFKSSTKSSKTITIKTDVLSIQVDLEHGDIIEAKLLEYPESIQEKNTPVTILDNTDGQKYVANSALLSVEEGTLKPLQLNYSSEQGHYQLEPNQNELHVRLVGQSKEGLKVEKSFRLEKGSYLIQVGYDIDNQSQSLWKGYLNTQLLRGSPKEDKSSMFHIGTYTGASYSNPGEHRYQKVSFAQMKKNNLDVDAKGGWIAMQQHYFLSAWVPEPDQTLKFYTRSRNNDFSIGAVSQLVKIAPGTDKQLKSRLYVGPEITSVLNSISPNLGMTVDYGLLWFFSAILFSVMKMIYSFVGNWGWAIVLVTVLIKLAFYRLSAASYRSMAGMRKLQPKLMAIRERYADDKAKISQATMELYRSEKINPLGGCLPILIQIPVFIALYWVLLESVELRQAPFILWINDLASADPYHVLPLIMGGTMLIQQKLNPAPPDPLQAKIMMFLPIMFTALFWSFPAGLVLYWIVNNSLSILQQWYITNKYSDTKPSGKKLAPANK